MGLNTVMKNVLLTGVLTNNIQYKKNEKFPYYYEFGKNISLHPRILLSKYTFLIRFES